MTMDASIETIQTALRYLAGNDIDRAKERNGVGFNAFDGVIGHDLASRNSLSIKQAELALKILNRYHRQLSAAGIVLPEKIEVQKTIETVNTNGHIVIDRIGDNVGIVFDTIPAPEDRAQIKKIQGYKWNPDLPGKPWTVPVKSLYELQKIFPVAIITEDAQSLYSNPVTENTTVQSQIKDVIEQPKPTSIFLRDGQVVSISKYNPENVVKLHGIGAFYEGRDHSWSVPVEKGKELLAIYPDAIVSDEVKQVLENLDKITQTVTISDNTFEVPGLKKELYGYQKTGVKFLDMSSGGVILSDEMGIGKSAQAIGYLHLHPEQRPAIIVVPASLKINWQREIDAWIGTKENIVILDGKSIKKDLLSSAKQATIIIINYDILGAWIDEIKNINPVVFIADEAHYLKNQKTSRWKSANALREMVKRVILLTGTPVLNRPAELFPLLNMIDPKRWNNFFRFARYCDAHQKEIPVPREQQKKFGKTRVVWDFNGASNLDELFNITRSFILRRTKKDVLKELPAKQRVTIALPISNTARNEYDKVLLETTIAVKNGLKEGKTHLALSQIETLKQECVKAKMESALEWIENFIESGEKLIVFATHHKTIDELYGHFEDVAVTLTGESSQKQRQYAVDAFQTDDKVKLFIGNIQAAGVGITLTAASNVAFIEFGWTPGEMEQAEDRAHRIGQTENVTAWYLIADNTVDEKIIDLLEQKRLVIENVTDGVISENGFESVANNFMAGLARGKHEG